MLLDKLQLGAVVFASTDDTRRSINQLYVHPDGTVEATNGHLAVRVKRTTDPNEQDFPVIIPNGKQPAAPISIMRELATSLLKQLKAVMGRAKNLPVLANVQVLKVNDMIAFGTTDLDAPTVSQTKAPDMEFPNLSHVIPSSRTADFAISFNPRYLLELFKYAASFDNFKPEIKMEFFEADQPVVLRWRDADHEAVAALMPMRFAGLEKMCTRKEMRTLIEGFRDAWAHLDGNPDALVDPEKAVDGVRYFYDAVRKLIGPPKPVEAAKP